ncbi:sensor histidine kinase [Pediococcus claussenii]|nr:GHKL domain-containing protein [Pediococcus claussenii]ANZ69866.1 hypothetical protein AYR57_05890 [Pediococcus claussenii]ANZ71683.1 hypothetical protein AYR58_05895 [Pediococcus claussenii]KRN20849.1 hypothetical protein IV79_GL000071 [Pediococcus claussenii]
MNSQILFTTFLPDMILGVSFILITFLLMEDADDELSVNKYLLAIFSVVGGILYFATDFMLNMGDWFLLVIVLISILYLVVIKRSRFIMLFIGVAFFTFLLVISLSALIGMVWYQAYIQFRLSDNAYGIMLYLTTIVAVLLVYFGIQKFVKKNLKGFNQVIDNFNEGYFAFFIVILVGTFLFIYYSFRDKTGPIFLVIVPTVTLLMLVGVLLSIFVLVKANRRMLAEQELGKNRESIRAFDEELEKQIVSTRKFRHDFKNIMLSLDGYVHEKDWSGLQKYVDDVNKSSESFINVNEEVSALNYIKNVGIKNLILQKYIYAKQNKIKFSIEIKEELPLLDKYGIDLIRILGILIDNAIEEAELSEQRKVILAYISFNDHNELIIANSIQNVENISISNLIKDGFTTKGNGHGNGLNTVSVLVDKSELLDFEIQIINQMFYANIILEK